jgi:ribosomal protein S18 acetylase RimI-like enzyme
LGEAWCALLDAAREFVISTGAKGVLLETGRDNKGAQRLYEVHGYVRDAGYHTYYLDLDNA